MIITTDEVNSIIRPTIKGRIGTQANVNGAKAFIAKNNQGCSYSGGNLAMAMLIEALIYTQSIVIYDLARYMEDSYSEDMMDACNNICAGANNTHSSGSKAAVGAMAGYALGGIIGGIIGAFGGYSVGQSASSNDLSAITMYANQAADWYCDDLCRFLPEKRILPSSSASLPFNQNDIANKGKAPKQEKPPRPKSTKKKTSSHPKFSDVIGLEEAKEAVQERVLDPLRHPDIYKKYGCEVGGGILLYGLPGTGKTMFAQAVANEIDGKFFSIKASDIKSKWFGESEGKIKELFEEARKEKVAVIFIDEFEALGVDRNKDGAGHDATASSIVPEILAQMQGFEEEDSESILLVMAATNRPWDIDSALTRPGRFDYKVYVDLPNEACRLSMLKNHLKKVGIDASLVSEIAARTDGYNGADIKAVSDALKKIAIRNEVNGVENYRITASDVDKTLKKIKTSVSQEDIRLMNAFRSRR